MNIAQNWRLKAQRYRLEGVKCAKCDHVMFPPRDICPQCRDAELKTKMAQKIETFALDVAELRAAR
jgi:uncharacterized OB-fold protein